MFSHHPFTRPHFLSFLHPQFSPKKISTTCSHLPPHPSLICSLSPFNFPVLLSQSLFCLSPPDRCFGNFVHTQWVCFLLFFFGLFLFHCCWSLGCDFVFSIIFVASGELNRKVWEKKKRKTSNAPGGPHLIWQNVNHKWQTSFFLIVNLADNCRLF